MVSNSAELQNIDAPIHLSIIIPARNEEYLISSCLKAIFQSIAVAKTRNQALCYEIIVVDNDSTDSTVKVVELLRYDFLSFIECVQRSSAAARNAGAYYSRGEVLCFIDADTLIAPDTFQKVLSWASANKYEAGLCKLISLEPSLRAKLWWTFWNQVRRLPLARAKAMSAFMFCTRSVFDRLGPFDQTVAIAEEWPILARFYRESPGRFIYDRTLIARSSSRRLLLQKWGMTKTLLKYAWVILSPSGRGSYDDSIRHEVTNAEIKPSLGKLTEFVTYGIGIALRHLLIILEINSVDIRGDKIHKERRWYAPFIIIIGNCFFRVSSGEIRVLCDRQWIEREKIALHRLYGHDVKNVGKAIIAPRLPGLSLQKVLIEESYDLEFKLRAVKAATISLINMHASSSSTMDSLSHGDAHVRNVLFDPLSDQAYWFDFETMHAKHLKDSERCAHDFWTFVTSLAQYFEQNLWSRLVTLVIGEVLDPTVLQKLHEMISFAQSRPKIFDIAQTNLSKMQRSYLYSICIETTYAKLSRELK